MSNQQAIEVDELFDSKLESFGLPVVSLEAFFNGNDDPNSIARNLDDHPGLQFFYEHLQSICNREDVADVFVEITDVEILEGLDRYLWPFSECVYIITTANQDEVSKWVEPLRADQIDEGWRYGRPPEDPYISKDKKVYAVSWN